MEARDPMDEVRTAAEASTAPALGLFCCNAGGRAPYRVELHRLAREVVDVVALVECGPCSGAIYAGVPTTGPPRRDVVGQRDGEVAQHRPSCRDLNHHVRRLCVAMNDPDPSVERVASFGGRVRTRTMGSAKGRSRRSSRGQRLALLLLAAPPRPELAGRGSVPRAGHPAHTKGLRS